MGTTAEKLTYLNTTKTQLKDMLNLGGASLTTEPFRQYVDTLKNRYLYFMNNGTQQVWDNWDKVNGTGTTLTLNNTEEAPMTIALKGNTSQISYSGKNKLNVSSSYSITTQVIKTINISAGTYTLSCSDLTTTTETNACLVQLTGETTQQIYMYYADKYVTFTTTEAKTSIKIYAGTTYANSEGKTTTFTNLMLESGSSKTSYEPYCGGIASPNPDYPQDVHVVTGDNTIKVEGKNLLGINNLIVGGTYEYYRFKEDNDNSIYTLSIKLKNGKTAKSMYIGFASNHALPLQNVAWLLNNGTINGSEQTDGFKSITNNYGTKPSYIVIYRNNLNLQDLFDNYDIQLVKGGTHLPYEPYQSQSYAVNLGTMELCKIGNYQDYFYKDNGKWYLHKEIGKVVFDENTPILSNADYISIGRFNTQGYNNIKRGSANNPNAISSHFTSKYETANGNIYVSGVQNEICLINTDYSNNLAGFKTWLGTEKPIAYYILATPTNTLIEDTNLIEQLEALESAMSYKGQTNISQINNDAPFIIDATALEEMS